MLVYPNVSRAHTLQLGILSLKVVSLLKNKSEAERMGHNGKKRILNVFGVERMIHETEEVYIKLLEREKNKNVWNNRNCR